VLELSFHNPCPNITSVKGAEVHPEGCGAYQWPGSAGVGREQMGPIGLMGLM